MKNLYKIVYSKKTYLLLILFTSIFASIFIYKVFFNAPSYYKVKCEGLVLNKNKQYLISNQFLNKKTNIDSNTILLEYPKNFGFMPKYLGKLFYDNQKNQWLLKLTDSIRGESKDNTKPFVRKAMKEKDSFEYFLPNQTIGFIDLEKGILINRHKGSFADRIALKLKEEEGCQYLIFNSEGITTEYFVKTKKHDFAILFNSQKRTADFNFLFEKTTKIKKEFKITINSSPFGYSCFFVNGKEIKKSKFILGDALFSIKSIHSLTQQISFVLLLLQGIFFSIFLAFKLNSKENPITKSVLLIRFLFNQLALIGLPLFVITFNLHEPSRQVYLVCLFFVFNLSHKDFLEWWFLTKFLSKKTFFIKTKIYKCLGFLSKKAFFIKSTKIINQCSGFLSKRAFFINIKKFILKNAKIIGFILSVLFFIIVIVIFASFNHNERIFGAPALHIQKLLIIVAYLIFASQPFYKVRYWIVTKINSKKIAKYAKIDPKNWLIFVFSLTLSVVSSDFGAILYVSLTIIIIELLKNKLKIKTVLFLIGVMSMAALVFAQLGVDFSKIYRVIYWVNSPDSALFDNFKESDKETMTYLFHGLKTALYSPFGMEQGLAIPSVCKTVAFSDYAFFWATMANGFPFLCLFLLIAMFLTFHFLFLLIISIRNVRINNFSMSVSSTKYAPAYCFFYAISIVSFTYPLFTNLALPFSMLTGQALPFLSVGMWDMCMIIIYIAILEYSFKTTRFVYPIATYSNNVNTSTVFKKTIKIVFSLFFVIIGLLMIKFFQVYNQKESVQIHKKESQKSQEKMVYTDRKQIGELLNNTENLNKKSVDDYLFFYYENKFKKEDLNPFKMTRSQFVKKIRIDSIFSSLSKKIVSGTQQPFGVVYKKANFINGDVKMKVTNSLYSNSLVYDSLNNDLNAEITEKLQQHIVNKMKNQIEGTVIIRNNHTGNDIVVATYSKKLDFRNLPVEHTPYFVGSVKKPLLLVCAIKIDEQYKNLIVKDTTMKIWIQRSSNTYTRVLLTDILKNNCNEFEEQLTKNFGMSFYSTGKSYSDYPREYFFNKDIISNENNIRAIGIGGTKRYAPFQVVDWYQRISNMVFEENDAYLNEIMNAPFSGTAFEVAEALKKNGINPKDFIAKTGTCQKEKLKHVNLSTSFAICNKDVTILVALNGEQASNKEKVSAKYFFNSIIPLLIKYDVLHKSKIE